MSSITIKNLPGNIHRSLKTIARLHHRSLNNEIIYCLKKYAGTAKVDTNDLLRKAEETRNGVHHVFSEEEIQKAREEGRR